METTNLRLFRKGMASAQNILNIVFKFWIYFSLIQPNSQLTEMKQQFKLEQSTKHLLN